MAGYRGDMASPKLWMLLATLHFVALSRAGPVGPLPNVTSADMGLKEGSCALGDVVYLPGDDFPGSDPCEKCKCSNGGVQCEKQQCEPRPGCKALHRPDHCCPTYQCECEQEGRVYSNGEKLVDPADPCRVCYCQGGEVVCRTIACFVRDDCTPRLVPGRCCPEYDNCPVRGVTALPGISSPPPQLPTVEEVKSSAIPSAPKENFKQEITIKEITPVSEIPVITDVKIKEILPSQSIDVAEYSSSKSPLIPREATSEKTIKSDADVPKVEAPTITEVHSLSSYEESKAESTKDVDDMPPSKISFSTQDSINSEIYPSNGPVIVTMGGPPVVIDPMPVATTTKTQLMEEEDTSLFDHNPAFPPFPEDFSVLSNHGDEIVPEPSADTDHVPVNEIIVPSAMPTESKVEEPLTTTVKYINSDTTVTTAKAMETSAEFSTIKLESTESTSSKESPMLNLRSAIPTELLSAPSYVPEDINGEMDDGITTGEPSSISTILNSEISKKIEDVNTDSPAHIFEEKTPTSSPAPELDTSTHKEITTTSQSTKEQEQTTSSIAKSNVATEVTSQTELSSLPIETSDQKPHETEVVKDKSESTSDPLMTSSRISPTGSEVITVSRAVSGENNMFENIETTEFILTAFGSFETSTDSVELIKISGDPEKNAPIIDAPEENKTNPLKDLINLVSDVASISDQTESPGIMQTTAATSISDSEELIPVNIGYKSKNNNANQNSITEIPVKSKNASGNKQKVVEIEDDDTDNITDSPPPNDKVEPTTRRPIIDNVSDDMPDTKTEKKDIEIITQSYVPTINRRPTKVVMKKNNEKPTSDSPEENPISISSEMVTEGNGPSSEIETMAPDFTTIEVERTDDSSNGTVSTSQ